MAEIGKAPWLRWILLCGELSVCHLLCEARTWLWGPFMTSDVFSSEPERCAFDCGAEAEHRRLWCQHSLGAAPRERPPVSGLGGAGEIPSHTTRVDYDTVE